jgi:two-component system NtrC family sensor kinase
MGGQLPEVVGNRSEGAEARFVPAAAELPQGEAAPGRGPAPDAAETRAPDRLPEIGASIPWRDRLATKLLGLTGILTLGVVGVFALVESQMQRQFQAEVARGAALVSETIRAGTHRAMMEDRRHEAYLTMETIGRQAGIEKVRMLNKEGRVTFSTDEAEVGRLVDKRAESCYACHAAGQPLSRISVPSRSRIYAGGGGHRVMGMVTPIYNERSCYSAACHVHPPGQQVLGVIDVDLSLAEVDERVATFRRLSLSLTAVGAVFLAVFLHLFTRRHVLRPVAALLGAARRVAGDQLDTEIPITTRDELGFLAASFNDMTRSLRRIEGELRTLMGSLERQVEERTAALKSAQAQLVQSEKLSSLGKLSASIAHEINNPLSGVLTFAKLIIRSLEEGPPDEAARKVCIKNLQLVQRETERCSVIVRNLLDFARERPMALKDVDVNAVVQEALSLLAHRIALQGVTLSRSLGTVPRVRGDFGQLRQALVNIALNACEAMAKGGRLEVATRSVEAGSLVEVELADTGPGIPREALGRIFDPFFTTKEKGTGLGLSVVYGIVKRHGGDIRVESEVGKGTRFVVRLPAAGPEQPGAAPPPGEPGS